MDDDEEDERMQIEGQINFPKELPEREEQDIPHPGDEEGEDMMMDDPEADEEPELEEPEEVVAPSQIPGQQIVNVQAEFDEVVETHGERVRPEQIDEEEISPEQMAAMQQQLYQQQQQVRLKRRIKKKSKRPMSAGKYTNKGSRPQTAKKKKKTKKQLHAVTVEDEQLTPDQAMLLHQQLTAMRDNGQLTQDQLLQLQALEEYQAQMQMQQMYEQQLVKKPKKKRVRPSTATGPAKRPKTAKKGKKKRARRQQMMTEEEQMMHAIQQNPELLHQLQMQQQMEGEEFDQIPEATGDDEESPHKQMHEMEGEDEEQSQQAPPEDDIENQNLAANLTPEELAILQQQSQNQMIEGKLAEYNKMYNPLAQTVQAAKQQHQGMAEYNLDNVDDGSHEALMAKKMHLEKMLRDYVHDARKDERLKGKGKKLKKKNKARDERIERIRMRNFATDLKNKQLSKMQKRDAAQLKLCKKIFKLASDLEKNKLIDEKKQAKKVKQKREKEKLEKLSAMEQKFINEMALIQEKIEKEKLD